MRRPNVLFVISDDLRPQLGCYGLDWIRSPRMDAFASESLLCERAYCQQAVCAPSRASVLTGCRPDTTAIYDLQTPVRSVMPDVLTMPQFFRQNGYETVSTGKVYHHREDDVENWTGGVLIEEGDWQGRGYLTDEAVEAVAEFNRRAEAEGLTARRGIGPAVEAPDVPDDAYPDGKDTARTIAELERLSGEDKPFFLAYGLHKPHLPFNAPKRYWDLYDRESIPLAGNPFPPEDFTAFTSQFGVSGEIAAYKGVPDSGSVPDGVARTLVHGYAACVSYIDTLFGRVLDALDRLDLADNTIVILWGDHGWKLGEHDAWCKHTNFEIDARAPLILHVPGRTGGQRTRALVEFVDMYPTLVDLCGLPLPEHLEGLSMSPLIEEPDRTWKSAAFGQYPRHGREIMGYAMRTDRYRYIEWQNRDTGEVEARELYDHESDPDENRNVAGHVEDPELVDRLSAQLSRGWRAAASGV